MIYLALFLIALAIFLYVTSRWLRAELRELAAWLGERTILARGGQSPERVIAETRRAFVQQGYDLHFLIVSRQVTSCYEYLRRHHMREPGAAALPAAVVLALAADIDAGRLFLRAVVDRAGAPAADEARFLEFNRIRSVEVIPARLPSGPAPDAERALEIHTTDNSELPFHLALEREWGISPDEIAQRIQSLLAGRWHPDAPPTIVR